MTDGSAAAASSQWVQAAGSVSTAAMAATLLPSSHSPQTALAETHIAGDIAARRKSEARVATIALGTAAVLSVLRATLIPLMMANVPPEKMDQFAAFVSPQVRIANYALAGVFILACLWAPRKPLHAALTALLLYLCYAIPDVAHNPVLIGGGHIGKLVTLGILGRATFAGVMHKLLDFE